MFTIPTQSFSKEILSVSAMPCDFLRYEENTGYTATLSGELPKIGFQSFFSGLNNCFCGLLFTIGSSSIEDSLYLFIESAKNRLHALMLTVSGMVRRIVRKCFPRPAVKKFRTGTVFGCVGSLRL